MRASTLGMLSLLIGIPGCLSLRVPAPEVHEYRLDYPPPQIVGQPLPVVLRVAPFGAAAAYDRSGIVYRDDEYSTGAYFYRRWAAQPASMIADLLARDLTASGLFRAVQQGASVLPSDYDLTADVEEIEERTTAGLCTAHLRLRALLSRARAGSSSRVAFQKTYATDEPCSGNNSLDFVAAMSNALRTISTALQHDIYDAILRDRTP